MDARRPRPLRILRTPEVLRRVNVSRTTLWRMWTKGEFPRPMRLSAGLVGWIEAEVDLWIEERRRDTPGGPA